MHPPLWSDKDLADEGFTDYAVRVEGLSTDVYDIVKYIGVKCDDETFVAAAERVTHRIDIQTTVAFYLEFGDFNVKTCK